MLYLPAIQIDGATDVRIPCSIGSLGQLCRSFIEDDSVQTVAIRVLAASPGLLVYTLAKFKRETGCPADDLASLTQWMDRAFFHASWEHQPFETGSNLDIRQQTLIVRWLEKRTIKRAARFLAAVTQLDRKGALQFLQSVWTESFQCSMDRGFPSHLPTTASSAEAPKEWPIAEFWMAGGKIQELRQSFETELQQRKLEAMKQLAYGASHEINNPLANIATRAQTLLTEVSNGSIRQRLAVIYAQAMRAHEMISDLMLFAQPPDTSFESVDIKSLVETVIGELASDLNHQEIVIGIRQYPDSEKCDLDATQFSVALKALLTNSIEAIGCGGEIRIQIWRRDESTIGLSVSDTGSGIDESVADQLFDPFYSGREAGRGLGFGLSKVWRIVDLHGGSIEIDSDKNWPTRIVISFPRRQPIPASTRSSRIDNFRAA